MSDARQLEEGLQGLGLVLCDVKKQKLLTYKALLLRWNKTFNLVSRNDQHRLIERHLLDSLSITRYIKGDNVADIGSGAGLPGVPLSIALETKQFTLIDRVLRKTRFLRQAVLNLGLENVSVESQNLAENRKGGRSTKDTLVSRFDTVVARALSEPHNVWQLAWPLLTPGGHLIVQCGLNTKVVDAFAGANSVQEKRFTQINGSQEYRVLVLEKQEGEGP